MTAPHPVADLVDASWAPVLAPETERIANIGRFLRAEVAEGRHYAPGGPNVFRAFRQPMDHVRVLIVGQDPYPTPGHAMGLSFSVRPEVRPIPKSLQNIFRELHDDVGAPTPANGDLRPWEEQGVMLLNRVLTCELGHPASHRGIGWEAVTERAIRALGAREEPLVAILWGRDARATKPMLPNAHVIESPHPSPLSAHRGFFGSHPFSRASAWLEERTGRGVDWTLPAA
jgi:uracil-DNA glycosylase